MSEPNVERAEAWLNFRDSPEYTPTSHLYPVREVFEAGWDALRESVLELHAPTHVAAYGTHPASAYCGVCDGEAWPCRTAELVGATSSRAGDPS